MKTLKILSIFTVLFLASSITFAQTNKKKQGKKKAKTEAKQTKSNVRFGSAGGPVPGREITVEQDVAPANNKKKAKKNSNNKSGTKK